MTGICTKHTNPPLVYDLAWRWEDLSTRRGRQKHLARVMHPIRRLGSTLLHEGGNVMEKQNVFKELVRFQDTLEADFLTGLLKYGDVTFKMLKSAKAVVSYSASSNASVVIQVLESDLQRAQELLAEYRKTQGVPFS